jgi:hypothetical protein
VETHVRSFVSLSSRDGIDEPTKAIEGESRPSNGA